jgi:hypothetical protein
MEHAPDTKHSSAGTVEAQPARREWVKPEVKSAHVAQATLNAHAVPPHVDNTTCAS